MAGFVTPQDVAHRLNVTPKTVYRWLKEGKLPGRRFGKEWRISESVLEVAAPESQGPFAARSARDEGSGPPSILDQVDAFRAMLARFGRVLEGAEENGIEHILGPRRSSERTKREIGDLLEASDGEVLLQGVALREFFSDKDYSLILRKKLANDDEFKVKALLLDPSSAAARARAVVENGAEYAEDSRYRESPLFSDIRRSVSVIRSLKEQRVALNKSRFDVEVRFSDCAPTSYLVLTNKACFIEPYHMGRENAYLDGSCVGELTPILKLGSDSSFYKLLRNHFCYVWEGTNPFMTVRSLEQVCAVIFD